jgi:hypothetical protein
MEGLVSWVTDYDFELKLDRYVSIVILKHAVWDATEIDFHRFRQPIKKHRPAKKPYNRDFRNKNNRPRGQSAPSSPNSTRGRFSGSR